MRRPAATVLAILALSWVPLAGAGAQDATSDTPGLTDISPAPAPPPAEVAPAAPPTADTAPVAAAPVAQPAAPEAAAPAPIAPAPVVAPPAPATPPTPVEAAIRAWVAAADASPDWAASVGAVAVDPVTGNATVSDLSVTAEKPGFTFTAGQIVVAGYQPTAAGTFAAREIDARGVILDAGDYSVRIDHAAVTAPVLPTVGGTSWDDEAPAASLVHMVAALLGARAAAASADKITVVETVVGVATWTTYANVKVSDFADGRIAALTAGPLRTDSPGADPAAPPVPGAQPPLVTLTVASAESHDIDLAATLIPFQDGAGGDTAWHQSIGRVIYDTVAIDVPGIGMKIGDVTVDNFVVRRSTAPAPPTDPPPAASAKPGDFVRNFGAGLAPYGVGRLDLNNLDVTAAGLDGVHLGNLTLVDGSTDSIGAFSLADLTGGMTGQGKVAIGRLAFGNLVLPSFGMIADAVDTKLAGGDVKYSSLVPTLSYGEIGGIDVSVTGSPEVKLGRLRVDLGAWADKIPTAIGVALAGLDLPAALIPSDLVQRLLAAYGYDRLQLDGGANVTWAANGDIAVRNASLVMKDAGTVSGQADLAGIPPADAEHVAIAADALDKLSLKGGTATFADASLVARTLSAQATKLNVDPERFRDQFAKSVPFMLMLLGDRNLITEVSPVVQTFLRTGGSITATAAPAAPVALSAVAETARSSPWGLFSQLGVTLTGVAGTPAPLPALPAAPPAPAVPAAPAAPAPAEP